MLKTHPDPRPNLLRRHGRTRFKKQAELRVGQCWSHARREFYERQGTYPQEAGQALAYIDRLFAIEAKAKTFEELKQLRQTESRDVIHEFHVRIPTKAPPDSGSNPPGGSGSEGASLRPRSVSDAVSSCFIVSPQASA